MTTLRCRATLARLVVACLATLVLTLAACASANPSASPSAGVISSTGAAPSASVASSDSPSPSAAATPSAGPATAAATQPQSIHLIVHPIHDTLVSVGSLTGCKDPTCQGDYIIGNDPLVDAATGANAGTMAYECFVVDPGSTLYHCQSTFTLTGRGQIVFAEVIVHETGGPSTTAPITGGTGEFLGVTGVVTASKVAEGGDFVITFTK